MSSQYKQLKKLRNIFYNSLFTVSTKLKHKYAYKGGQEAALIVGIMAQAAEDFDLEYFESKVFKWHCNLIPANFILEHEDVEDNAYANFIIDLSTWIATGQTDRFITGCRSLFFMRGV